MPEWAAEMEAAMKAISSACKKSETMLDCQICPFYKICALCLADNQIGFPEDWFKDEPDKSLKQEDIAMREHTIHPNNCGNCKHWHEWPQEKQRYSIPMGDCDKIKEGTPFDGYIYSGYSFSDECYDEEFGCFEEDE